MTSRPADLPAVEGRPIMERPRDGAWETVAHDPRVPWPETVSVAADGHLHATANQLHRQAKHQGGEDRRRKPCTLFRVRLGARPVLPRRPEHPARASPRPGLALRAFRA